MKRQSVRSDQIPYSNPGAQRRRASRKKSEPEVTVRRMTDEEFDQIQIERTEKRAAERARRRKALAVLGTDPKAERVARQRRWDRAFEMAAEAARIEEGETAGKKPSDYRRKIKRK